MDYQYSIKDVIDITGITKRTLHYYDEIGLLSPKKDSRNYRIYSQQDLVKLQKILLLKALDFNIKAIAKLLEANEDHLITSMRAQLNVLDDKIKKLQQTKRAIHQYVNGVPIIEIEEVNEHVTDQYQKEAQIKYGNSNVYQTFSTRNTHDTFSETQIKNDLDAIFEEFKHVIHQPIENECVRDVVIKWKNYMNSLANFDDEVLCGIANTYYHDVRFHNYFKKFGTLDITRFISEAVSYHLNEW
ncbi:MerR family transcriptional regulator [Staphylococcus agnetis]|uniref:MerR family transcriptional regulator n=1 Tax=Staphylococcus agnetis TaxID=985762 RepID=A0ABX3Z4H6_9STAP|nr:MerR family transcriptional regulator [Staphylococcus agnetis]ALN77063.1 MerR family transcriptional regulator [Staphylococcus agnetis]OSP17823.1 MerR family transcriptional regulator [Staphylococcus agnetis]OSP24765.1 MerR family transcriptional regulator [Staphylococcus agnetis]OTW31831.1 MerR family transcriptional regulator [Staphylococcus agnetis]UXU60188.1 MerR family transcriptional regulator [Staphylococcus agnetis]